MLTTNSNSNGAAISLSGSTLFKNSAVLAYGDDIISPLQIFNTRPGEQKNVNEAISCGQSNNCNTWYYGDFKIFYDPCICQNKASWLIKFDLINTQEINWETNGVEEQILGPGTSGSKKNTFLSIAQATSGAATGAIKAAKQGYKQGKSFEDDINNWVEENNQCFWPNADNLLSSSGVQKLSSLLSLAPGVSAAFSAVNFLSTAFGFLKKDQGTIVSPYRSKIKHSSEGYIISSTHPLNQISKVPGSKQQNILECINGFPIGDEVEDVSLRKPIYDRPLGVVSLITPISIEYVEYKGTDVVRKATDLLFNGSVEYVTPNPVREYKLSNNLKFAVNPASDLEIESVEAAFYFDFPNVPSDNCMQNNWKYPVSDFGPFVLGKLVAYGPYYLKSIYGDEYGGINNCGHAGSFLPDIMSHYNKSNIEVFSAENRQLCQPGFQQPWTNRVNIKDIKFKTVTVPIELLNSYSFKLFYDGSNPFEKLKFNIFLRHKISGKKFLEIVSYKIRPDDIIRSPLDPLNLKYDSEIYKSTCFDEGSSLYFQHFPVSISSSPFSSSLGNYPSVLNISNQNISNDQTAIYQINIGPNTTFSASLSNPIVIRAQYINVDPGVLIPPYVTLISGFKELFSDVSYIANLADIKAVCISNDYTSRVNLREAVSYSDEPFHPMISPFRLYFPIPNPTTGTCSIDFDLAESGGYEMYMSNSLGLRVKDLRRRAFTQSGKYSVQFNTEDLEAGVYYITLSAEGLRQARKLVVVK